MVGVSQLLLGRCISYLTLGIHSQCFLGSTTSALPYQLLPPVAPTPATVSSRLASGSCLGLYHCHLLSCILEPAVLLLHRALLKPSCCLPLKCCEGGEQLNVECGDIAESTCTETL
jgi:hypothetical protein